MPRLISCCLLLALSLPAAAQIYKYTDEKGNTVFTNQPPGGVPAQEIRLQQPNTIQSAPAEPASGVIGSGAAEEGALPYEQLAIGNLPTEEALRANNGTFSVDVLVAPTLAPTHRLHLLLDGAPYGEPTSATRIDLVNVDRGEHSLAVEVINAAGETVQRSEPVTFTVQRVNVNTGPAFQKGGAN